MREKGGAAYRERWGLTRALAHYSAVDAGWKGPQMERKGRITSYASRFAR